MCSKWFMTKFYDFQKVTFQIMCLNPKLFGIAKLANTFISQISILMTSFERSLSKLSENHKMVDIR